MSIERTFEELLTEKLHPELLRNEIQDRSYILTNSEKDNEWKGGNYGFGFEESSASSLMYDGFTDENDIGQAVVARGNITEQKILTGSLIFNFRDLLEHDTGKITEASFLKILPRHVNDFSLYMKSAMAQNLLTGEVIVKGTAIAGATEAQAGKCKVSRIDRLMLGQKVEVESTSMAKVDAYVAKKSIKDRSDLHVVLVTARGGSTPVDLTLSVGETIKFYHPNGKGKGFSSVKKMLLQDENEGGSAEMFGLQKEDYTYLQNMEFDAAAAGMTSANILDIIFDYFTDLRTYTSSVADEIWCSYKHFAAIIKQLEGEKKAFNVVPNSRKVNKFGWQEITIGDVTGTYIKFVAMKECDDDFMTIVDPKTFKFASNGLIRQVADPEGKKYYTVRKSGAGGGFFGIVDWQVFGEYFCTKPCENALIKNIAL